MKKPREGEEHDDHSQIIKRTPPDVLLPTLSNIIASPHGYARSEWWPVLEQAQRYDLVNLLGRNLFNRLPQQSGKVSAVRYVLIHHIDVSVEERNRLVKNIMKEASIKAEELHEQYEREYGWTKTRGL